MSKKQSRAKVQAFGGFLTGMVIPNMGAFIAWGFITALFIPTGWFPNSYLAELVGPMITYLLPLLLAYTGGKMIYGTRGGVAATIATFGLIVGSSIPMFLGAMVMGPIGALIIKKFDELVEDHIPTGFEMVINNFSLGIIGLLVCLLSYVVIGPVIQAANGFVTVAIEALVATGFLPLLSLINEPAKVLFLNNVIDQGIYYPLGMQQTLEAGKSVYFLVASNPGTGLGLLLAFFFFGNKASRENAPGAMIIHFIGGIHEIYFPYVLMKPLMIIPMILGGATGTLIFTITRVGLVAGPSPGSIISYLALTPKGNFFGIIAGVIGAGVVSFLVASFILKVRPQEEFENLDDSTAKAKAMKQEGKDLLANTMNSVLSPIKKIAFACDAGMGSSALGANAFKKQLKEINPNIEVQHFAIESVPSDFDVIVTHSSLLDRAKIKFPNRRIVIIEQFLKDPALTDLIEEIKKES